MRQPSWPNLHAASPVRFHCVAVTVALLHSPCARQTPLASDALMHMLSDPRSTQSPCACSLNYTAAASACFTTTPCSALLHAHSDPDAPCCFTAHLALEQAPCTASAASRLYLTRRCIQGCYYMPSMQRITSLKLLPPAPHTKQAGRQILNTACSVTLELTWSCVCVCAYRFCTQARLVNRRQSQR